MAKIPGTVEETQIRKLARVLCEESDASVIELGLATPANFVPFDALNDASKATYENLARRMLSRLAWDANKGQIVVLDQHGGVIL